MDALVYARDHGYDIIEVTPAAEAEWTTMVDTEAVNATFIESSYFYGSNIPVMPRRYLLNPMGRPKLLEMMAEVIANDYKAYALSRSSESIGTRA